MSLDKETTEMAGNKIKFLISLCSLLRGMGVSRLQPRVGAGPTGLGLFSRSGAWVCVCMSGSSVPSVCALTE